MNNKQFFILSGLIVLGFAWNYQKSKRIRTTLDGFTNYYFEWEDYYYQQEVDEAFENIVENL